MIRKLYFILLLFIHKITLAQQPHVTEGKLIHIENFKSKFVASRNIDVWLPIGYTAQQTYNVLYMHDGQMLFDSSITWNHQSWQLAHIMQTNISSQLIKPCIVVGIWNNGNYRRSEYFPEKALQYLSAETHKKFVAEELMNDALADEYLQFIVEELKPYIDSNYSVGIGAVHTYIAGASMGALISLYALCEYPKVFGGAACLSTHWIGSIKQPPNVLPIAIEKYLQSKLQVLKNKLVYFDYGTKTLDSLYAAHQQRINTLFESAGYSHNYVCKVFVGDEHSETFWSKRFDKSLLFLIGKNN